MATLLAVMLVFGVTGCIKARAGTRCRSSDWGDGGAVVLRCIGGRWKAVMTRQQAINALVALAAPQRPAAGDVVRPTSLGLPNIPNAADPSVLVDGGVTYVYATSTYQRVPVAQMTDPEATLASFRTSDAMPTTPAWASSPEIWAPSVARLGSQFVMFFAAHRSGAPNANSDQCVGRAWSSSPLGPFAPDPSPVNCGNDGVSGALDPSVFISPAGNVSLLVAMGGSSSNIWSIPLDAAANPTGPAVLLLTREQPWQDWFLENPAMFYDGSVYLLAYSAGHWDTAAYQTGIARCASPAGPCTDLVSGPWLSSVGDRSGPGGLEFFRGADGVAWVAFQTYTTGDIGPVGKRATRIARFYTDPWPRLG